MRPRDFQFAAALLTLVCSAADAATPTGTPARLSQVVNTAQAQGFAGEVLVADADSVWFEQAVGLARRKPDIAHKPGAVWRWGSVSKQVTVTMAMQLVDAGQLKLDDTLAQRWPAYPAPGAAQITVRHLMQHVSGLAQPGDGPTDADGVLSFYRREGPPWQPEALRICAGPARAVPGERFFYGDCDTLVLAGLLEHLTGQTIPQLMQQRVAQPLKLRSLRLNEGRTRAMAVAMDAGGQPVPQPVMATWSARLRARPCGPVNRSGAMPAWVCGLSPRRSPAVPSPWNWWSAAAMWVASRRATSSRRGVACRS